MDFPDIDVAFLALAATVLVAGVARGLSGFGTGMIVAPVAGALYGPKAALAIIVIMDSLPTIPVTVPALRIATWREVLPAVIGLILLIPAGVWILTVADPLALRWLISFTILLCAVALARLALWASGRLQVVRRRSGRRSPLGNRPDSRSARPDLLAVVALAVGDHPRQPSVAVLHLGDHVGRDRLGLGPVRRTRRRHRAWRDAGLFCRPAGRVRRLWPHQRRGLSAHHTGVGVPFGIACAAVERRSRASFDKRLRRCRAGSAPGEGGVQQHDLVGHRIEQPRRP